MRGGRRGRPLEKVQSTNTVLLVVTRFDLWNTLRQMAIEHDVSLSRMVEDILAQNVNVRQANG